jgi:NADH:ubiquinone oxidoreductase subunit F (NADH-binding)
MRLDPPESARGSAPRTEMRSAHEADVTVPDLQRAKHGVAQARARDSFFADRSSESGLARICQGTSCLIRSGVESAVTSDGGRTVQCAGYCDRSPVVLRPDGSVVQSGGDNPLTPLPAIRSLSRRAIVTERIAHGAHHALGVARAAGVWRALEIAVRGEPETVLRLLEASGERGRGGAGFPTGAKWRVAAESRASEKVVIANGDEGDPGSYVDRVLLESDPHAVLEGLALCAFAIGARHGVVYVRSEYPRAALSVERAIDDAHEAGLLGAAVAGSGFAFDVRVARGEGAYVCGEETALIAALEGRRGEVRVRPPYPTTDGLFGAPTVVNNVETLVNVPWLARNGLAAFRALGTEASRGTKVICLNAGFARPGIVEVEFGFPLRALIEDVAGGACVGGSLAAVALGGPMGSVLLPEEWDAPLCFAELEARGIELGHGGLVALPHGTDFRALASHWLAFMADESCGKCVPCRVGSRRAFELARARSRDADAQLLPLLEVISAASLCAFGQAIPNPVRTLLLRLDPGFARGGTGS